MEGLYRENKASLKAGGWLPCQWTNTENSVADTCAIAGSEFPPENITGDYCKASHCGP